MRAKPYSEEEVNKYTNGLNAGVYSAAGIKPAAVREQARRQLETAHLDRGYGQAPITEIPPTMNNKEGVTAALKNMHPDHPSYNTFLTRAAQLELNPRPTSNRVDTDRRSLESAHSVPANLRAAAQNVSDTYGPVYDKEGMYGVAKKGAANIGNLLAGPAYDVGSFLAGPEAGRETYNILTKPGTQDPAAPAATAPAATAPAAGGSAVAAGTTPKQKAEENRLLQQLGVTKGTPSALAVQALLPTYNDAASNLGAYRFSDDGRGVDFLRSQGYGHMGSGSLRSEAGPLTPEQRDAMAATLQQYAIGTPTQQGNRMVADAAAAQQARMASYKNATDELTGQAALLEAQRAPSNVITQQREGDISKFISALGLEGEDARGLSFALNQRMKNAPAGQSIEDSYLDVVVQNGGGGLRNTPANRNAQKLPYVKRQAELQAILDAGGTDPRLKAELSDIQAAIAAIDSYGEGQTDVPTGLGGWFQRMGKALQDKVMFEPGDPYSSSDIAYLPTLDELGSIGISKRNNYGVDNADFMSLVGRR